MAIKVTEICGSGRKVREFTAKDGDHAQRMIDRRRAAQKVGSSTTWKRETV